MTEHEILWACSAYALYMLTVLIGYAVWFVGQKRGGGGVDKENRSWRGSGVCPCVPLFGIECEYEKYHKDLLGCSVHILNKSFRELCRTIPIIADSLEEYRCPDYEPIKTKVGESDDR